MIKSNRKDQVARMCITFESNLEKIKLKTEEQGDSSAFRVLNQIKNMDLIVKGNFIFIIDKDSNVMYTLENFVFVKANNLFNKQYYGFVATPEDSDYLVIFGDDSLSTDKSVIIKVINIKVG